MAQPSWEFLGGRTQGNPESPWTFEAPPALKNEQLGVAVALLWTLQGCSFAYYSRIFLHFDCYAAGWPTAGAWQPVNEFLEDYEDP